MRGCEGGPGGEEGAPGGPQDEVLILPVYCAHVAHHFGLRIKKQAPAPHSKPSKRGSGPRVGDGCRQFWGYVGLARPFPGPMAQLPPVDTFHTHPSIIAELLANAMSRRTSLPTAINLADPQSQLRLTLSSPLRNHPLSPTCLPLVSLESAVDWDDRKGSKMTKKGRTGPKMVRTVARHGLQYGQK